MARVIVFVLMQIFIVGTMALTNVNRCKNGQPFPLSVNIEGCEEPPCEIIKGRIAVMEVHFVGTKDNLTKLTAKAHAYTFGLTVPYELPPDVADVCSNLMYDAMCPIDATEDVVYKFNFFIDNTYPEIGTTVQLNILDHENDSVACFMCSIRVKKGPKQPSKK